jgi:arylsulfatase A-like enzyme
VIAIDALRADHISGYGYDRETTPRLDLFSEEAAVFTEAWSAGPGIVPAHVALLTGCDPRIAKRPVQATGGQETWFIPENVPRLAQSFLAERWDTAAFVDHQVIGGLRGFSQGFREYVDYAGGAQAAQQLAGIDGVGRRFVEWIDGVENTQDWFAYIHMNDLDRMWRKPVPEGLAFEPRPELDIIPPVAMSSPSPSVYFAVPHSRWGREARTLGEYESQYDSALRQIDNKLEHLFYHLKEIGLWETTTIVIVGSFGVGLTGEEGFILNSGTLSDVDLHVPLIIRPAESLNYEASRIKELTSIIDVAPTLLEIVGIEGPSGMHGVSHVPAMRKMDAAPAREYAFAGCGAHAGWAVIDKDYCFEHAQPGIGGGTTLRHSWYGDDLPHKGEFREHLHDRAQGGHGHLGPLVDVDGAADRLRTIGEERLQLLERARDALHQVPWKLNQETPEELAELRELGLIGQVDG